MTKDILFTDLVPHQRTMALIDTIVSCDSRTFVTEVVISKGSLFAQEHGVPSWVGIEYMAQTVAACVGYRQIQKNQEIAPGFLLGARKYTCNQAWFRFGDTLRIEACSDVTVGSGIGAFNSTIVSKEVSAAATLVVFQPDNSNEFIDEVKRKRINNGV